MLLYFKNKERICAKEKIKVDMMDQALEKFNREIASLNVMNSTFYEFITIVNLQNATRSLGGYGFKHESAYR